MQSNLLGLFVLTFALSPRREFNGRIASVWVFAAAEVEAHLSTTSRCSTFDPCTYHRSNLAYVVNSFSEMQFSFLRLVAFLPCSAVSESPPDTLLLPLPGTIGLRFQFRTVSRTYLPQGTTPQVDFFPLAISNPCRVSYVFPHLVLPPCRACILPTVGPP